MIISFIGRSSIIAVIWPACSSLFCRLITS